MVSFKLWEQNLLYQWTTTCSNHHQNRGHHLCLVLVQELSSCGTRCHILRGCAFPRAMVAGQPIPPPRDSIHFHLAMLNFLWVNFVWLAALNDVPQVILLRTNYWRYMDAFRHTKTGVNSESKQSKKAMGGSVVVGVVCGRRGLRSLVSFVAVVRWFAAVDRRRRRRRRRWWSLVVVFVGNTSLVFFWLVPVAKKRYGIKKSRHKFTTMNIGIDYTHE